LSFIGTINEKLRKFFYTHARLLEGRTCYIGCSGNFTIEQIISRLCPATVLHSNDVSLYSAAIGHMLTGQPLALEATNPELTWANNYLSRGPAEQVATILLLLDLLQFEKRNNPYAERMWQGYLTNFESLFTRTLDKVRRAAAHIRLASYSMVDVFDYYPPPPPAADPSAVAIGFLPTYVGGYEKLFARLEQSISWPCPSYQLLTEERREETIARMISTDYIVYDDRSRDLPCVARVDLFGKRTVYIYSSLGFRHAGIFRKKINEKVSRYDLLMPDDQIAPSAPITVTEVDLPTINHYRNMFLSKKIQPGSGGPCYLVFAASKLFGFLIFQSYSARGGAKDEIYMLSDFVVPSSSHRRLAKLLLMVTRCQDTQRILSERLIRDYRAILTTAFTDQPVSMKYRGIYELVKRGQGFLNYRGEFDATSFKEVTATWMKKYEKR
jgi:hypothetical protein